MLRLFTQSPTCWAAQPTASTSAAWRRGTWTWRSWKRSCRPSCLSSEQSTSSPPTATCWLMRSVPFRRYPPPLDACTLLDRRRLSTVAFFFPLQLKRGLLSTPPSDMLPTAEGGKANAWLRQKNAGIYVRPRLFSPYVEEAKVRSSSNTIQWSALAPVNHFVFEVAIIKESAGPTKKRIHSGITRRTVYSLDMPHYCSAYHFNRRLHHLDWNSIYAHLHIYPNNVWV